MPESGTRRYLVLSDMHFGTPESSINDARYRAALVAHLVAGAPWEEVIFTGDLLDINLSTLTRSLEGNAAARPPIIGFRGFLEEVARLHDPVGVTLPGVAKRWVYVPGNHDYKVWDLLATEVVCQAVLSSGQRLGTVPTPLMQYTWRGPASFFSGIFAPLGVQQSVVVTYPNHEIPAGEPQQTIVLTHGHYLDPSQTRGKVLAPALGGGLRAPRPAPMLRELFIETAQYQTLANLISFTRGTIRIVDEIFGPAGLGEKAKRLWERFSGWLLGFAYSGSAGHRGKPLTGEQLENIERYLEHFSGYPRPLPRWFVFGHTHRQGQGASAAVQAYNVGSCYPDTGRPITFGEIEVTSGASPVIQLRCVDQAGHVATSAP